MDEAKLEQMEEEVDDKIMALNKEELMEVARGLVLNDKYTKESSVINTRRGIRKFLESVEKAERETLYTNIIKTIGLMTSGRIPPDESKVHVKGVETEEKTSESSAVGVAVTEKATQEKPESEPVTVKKVDDEANKKLISQLHISSDKVKDINHLLHKEFKLNGQIGNADQKDKITYIGLMRQMNEGIAKGYSESEISSAVIRSMIPGLQLRAYLECTPDIPLIRMRNILRSHFREKSSTELYQELTSMTQKSNEDALSFILRAFELRTKVGLASEEEGALKYDKTLVQGLTIHTIETGLSAENENIRNQLRPFLKTPGITDVELITQMRTIIAAEENRKDKLKTSGDQTLKGRVENQVNAIKGINNTNNLLLNKLTKIENQLGDVGLLTAQVSQLRSEVNQLKSPSPHNNYGGNYYQRNVNDNQTFNNSQQNVGRNQDNQRREQGRRPIRFKCQDCQAKGVTRCLHCFKCGEDTHFAKDCQQSIASNTQGLLGKGRQ